MSIACERDLLCVAGHLCNAADSLRAVGLVGLAREIESFIAMIEAEIVLSTSTDD